MFVGGAETIVIIAKIICSSPSIHSTHAAVVVLSALMRVSNRVLQYLGLGPLRGRGRPLAPTEMLPNYWSPDSLRKNNRLTTSKPHGVIRHPSYSAVMIVHLGVVCLGSSSRTLPCIMWATPQESLERSRCPILNEIANGTLGSSSHANDQILASPPWLFRFSPHHMHALLPTYATYLFVLLKSTGG